MYPFHQRVEVTMKDNKNGTVYTKLHLDADLGVLGLLPKWIIKNRVDALVQPLVDKFFEILESESILNKKNK
jgi:hypothetical protein